MEKENLFDNFEKLIKEKSDEFRMYPSAKVWHSLYNNMHPGRKWPSLAVSIFLLIGLFGIGYLNNTTKNNNAAAFPKSAVNTTVTTVNNFTTTLPVNYNNATNLAVNAQPLATNYYTLKNRLAKNIVTTQTKTINDYNSTPNAEKEILVENQMHLSAPYITDIANNIVTNVNAKTEQFYQKLFAIKNEIRSNKKSTANNKPIQEENASSKFGIQIYASPSVAYSNNTSDDKTTSTSTINTNSTQPSLGLEVGASMQYAVLKIMKIKTGLQLNYNSYYGLGNQQKDGFKSDNIFNDIYPVNFKNETYQISLPVGVEVKLLGNESLKLNVGATIQPTYVMGINGYSINNNKIDNSSSNNWNLNAGFETFVTYKLKGLTWQLGPQFRYRFLSGYNKNYYIPQSNSNYGVKLGVTKVIR